MHRHIPLTRPAILLAGTLAALLFVLAASAAEDAPKCFSSDFSAVLQPDSKSDIDLEITGHVAHSYPFTRIEFQHPLTMEDIVLVIDAGSQTAYVLYPDTLNGLEYHYAGKYYADWPKGFAGYLSSAPSDHPEGWKKSITKSDGAGGQTVVLSKDALKVECTLDSKSQPSAMNVVTEHHSAKFKFSNYRLEESLDAKLFKVPEGYSIEPVSSLGDDEALPL